jgi:hypothetical protein
MNEARNEGPDEHRDEPPREAEARSPKRRWMTGRVAYAVLIVAVAVATAGVTALLTNIFERKVEQRQPYVRVVEVTEDTTDAAVWGRNWPSQYDGYKRTSLPTKTRFGGHSGSEALPEGGRDGRRARTGASTSAKSPMAPGLHRRREQHGVSRPPRGGPPAGGGHRLRAAGTGGGASARRCRCCRGGARGRGAQRRRGRHGSGCSAQRTGVGRVGRGPADALSQCERQIVRQGSWRMLPEFVRIPLDHRLSTGSRGRPGLGRDEGHECAVACWRAERPVPLRLEGVEQRGRMKRGAELE